MRSVVVRVACCVVSFFVLLSAKAQKDLDSIMPVRGFAIAAPERAGVDSFVRFINEELALKKVNTLILRVDYNYQYGSHPELSDKGALSLADVKKITGACKQKGIRIIPQINLLGHQSWAGTTGKLLAQYPQFDETPWVKMPQEYKWPNKDSLYCKSYCPLHPDVHKIVFAMVDELCTAFESNAFHAGLDEVFYIGEKACPRCSGKSKPALFAGEVKKIRDHLATNKRELWMWGDRLLDGVTTGLGMWEASFNNTHTAVDLIPKDVVICDWHYERPDKTAVYFAMKGFRVVTCSWQNPDVAVAQVKDMQAFRQHATKEMKSRYLGMMETVWSPVRPFLNGYYNMQPVTQNGKDTTNTPWHTFKAMYAAIEQLQQQ